MKRVLFILAIIFIAIVIVQTGDGCLAQEYAMVTEDAIILDLENTVEVRLNPQAGWIDGEAGMVLSSGAEIKTGPDSWAEIGLEIAIGNENVVRVGGDSTVTLTQIKPTRFDLLKGELRSLVQGIEGGSTFEIKTPVAVCGARGTGWDTGTDGKRMTVNTYEEEVFFTPLSADAAKAIIKAGKTGLMKDPASGIIIDNLPGGKMNEWNKWKDDMSRRTGIKVGIKGKIKNTEKNIKDVIKSKEKALERKDVKDIRDRLSDRSDSRADSGYDKN